MNGSLKTTLLYENDKNYIEDIKPIIHSYIVFVFGSKDTGEAMYHSTKEIRDSIGALKQDNISYMKRYIKNENQEE